MQVQSFLVEQEEDATEILVEINEILQKNGQKQAILDELLQKLSLTLDQILNFAEFRDIIKNISKNFQESKIDAIFRLLGTLGQESFTTAFFKDALKQAESAKQNWIITVNRSRHRRETQPYNKFIELTQKLIKIKELHISKEIDIAKILNDLDPLSEGFLKIDIFKKMMQICLNQEGNSKFFDDPEVFRLLTQRFDPYNRGIVKNQTFLKFLGLKSELSDKVQFYIPNIDFCIEDLKYMGPDQIKYDDSSDISTSENLTISKLGNPFSKRSDQSVNTNYSTGKQESIKPVPIFQQPFNFEKDYQYLPEIQDNQVFKEFEKKYKQLKEQKANFVDTEFNNNLFQQQGSCSKKKEQWKNYVWRRPHQFMKGEISLFKLAQLNSFYGIDIGPEISPFDIKQGNLGDCYYLSALSSIAEFPQRIISLFVTKKYNEHGIYCVKLNINGEWVPIYVDDYFPCLNDNSGPAFSRPVGNDIWVLILEKAWAQAFGSYQAIDGGFSTQSLQSLTGAPTEVYLTSADQNQNRILNLLQKSFTLNNKYILLADSFGYDQKKDLDYSNQGLIGGHCYSIIGYYQVKNPYDPEENVSLIQMRNPHGRNEWQGDWGNQWPGWEQDPLLQQKVKYKFNPQGSFYINYADFMQYFHSMTICYYQFGNTLTTIRCHQQFIKKAQYTQMNIIQEGKYYIIVNTLNQRCVVKKDLAQTKILIAKRERNEFLFQKAYTAYEEGNQSWVQSHFSPGEYVIYVKIFWENNKSEDQFVLASYGPRDVAFSNLDQKSDQLQNMVPSMYQDYMRKENFELQDIFKGYPGIQGTSFCFNNHGLGGIFILNSTKNDVRIKFEFILSKGAQLRKPHQDCVAVVQIPADGCDVICFSSSQIINLEPLKIQTFQVKNSSDCAIF